MNSLLVAVLTFAGLVVGGAVTYLAARRTTRGRIDTSEAVTLWDQSSKMRDYLSDALTRTTARLDATTTRLDVATERITELLHQVDIARALAAAAQDAETRATEETMKLRGAVEAVHSDVRTGNALTIGALADNAESRRIKDIAPADRTDAENDHIDSVGITTHSPGGNP